MLSSRTSQIIELYRFPLAVLVVLIHYTGVGGMVFSSTNLCEVTGYDAYSFIRILFSRVISQVAVPVFFLMSGYLFLQGLREWNWLTWRGKVERRIHSLLIPYLLWITMYVCYSRILHVIDGGGNFRLYDILFSDWHFIGYYYNCIYADTANISWAGTISPTCCPIFIPFWYIRDLMFMVILSPVIFFLLKKLGRLYVLFLLLAYVSQIWPVVPGLSIRAVCFFSLGGFLAMHTCHIPKIVYKIMYVAVFCLAIMCCRYYNSFIYWRLLPWFVLSACIMLWDIGEHLANRNIKMPTLFVKSTFFLYAFHIFLLNAWELIAPQRGTLLTLTGEYFFIPIIVVSLSVLVYYVLDRWCHRVLKVLVGR